jgi:hypothetical protein
MRARRLRGGLWTCVRVRVWARRQVQVIGHVRHGCGRCHRVGGLLPCREAFGRLQVEVASCDLAVRVG